MPKLPNPDEIQRVAPRPNTNVAGYRPGIEGAATREFGDNISRIADVEIKRLDELKAADAETELMRKELELSAEYRQVKGGDVMKPDFHKNFQDKYNIRTSEIESGLSTPAQKARFQQLAKKRSVSFDASRITYAMGEADRFETNQHEARVQVLTDGATAQYANPDVVAANALSLNEEVVKWGIKQGMNDPAIASAFHKKVNGDYYSALIEKAITSNDTSTANTLYAASSQFLSEAQNKSIANQLKVGNDYTAGQALAVEAQAMVTAGKPMAEVEAYVVNNAKTPGAYNAAQTIFGNFQQANEKAQKESLGTVYMLYEENGSNGRAKQAVLSSPLYAKLTDLQRADVIKYMELDVRQDAAEGRAQRSEGRAIEAYNEAKADRKKLFKSQETMAGVYRVMSNPEILKATSVEEIMSNTDKIGPENVKLLIAAKKSLETDEVKPKIDKSLRDSAKPNPKDRDAMENDAYEALVEIGLMEFQRLHKGKQPTLEEQQNILRNANAEYNVSGKWSSLKAYEMPSKEAQQIEARAKQLIIMRSPKELTPEEVDALYLESKATTGKIRKAGDK